LNGISSSVWWLKGIELNDKKKTRRDDSPAVA